ncbi:flagellar hook capping FlgD N-terminal domain-containing protein [Nitrospirillum amazonense]|uniref:Basal-body rod modification protein FlgD n=1 Tax=Nitrospirillum amazonense TaxID=28077 RepID=A0A560KGG9_9PROT|nr:flagellar hook capping FlgD N-terminal domain-containing protein [Nitrospirillum amazonense]MDG3441778.1 flagellar hook capping FlgD N-terminal domain-containing protein [Nitrospirillum amazonense]TWB79730.1 flagellar basal-body rod modification protein FlgD [Nitrospirillum amazonense]
MTDAVSGSSNTNNVNPSGSSGSNTPASNPLSDLTNNYTTFLTLLTTQLKNQDPTSPMDTNQMTQQLVQMSSVEQQIEANNQLKSIQSTLAGGQSSQALNYLGKYVEMQGDQFPLQNSTANVSVTYGGTAASATMSVYDSTGALVSTTDVSGAAGTHNYSWDGKDSSGKVLPDGTYSVKVTATDSSGKPVNTTVKVAGKVTGVDMSGATPTLQMGDMTVNMSDVTSVLAGA